MAVQDFVAYINTTQIHRIAAVFFIILLGIGMGVGFSVASNNAREAADKDYNHELSVFTQWQMDLTSHFTKVGSLAATMGAFASGLATGPRNMSAPSASRMEYLNPTAFARLGRQVYMGGVSSMVLAPGGVITQMWPPGSLTLGFDALGSPTYAHVLPQIHNSTAAIITGPNKFASRSGSGMLFWFPVHVNDTASLDTFWGAAFVVVAVDDLLDTMNITARANEAQMDYAIWYTTVANGTTPTVIAENNPSATSTVIAHGMRMQLPIAEKGRLSYLAIYPRGGPVSPNIKVGTAVLIVLVTMIGSALLIFAGVYLVAYSYFLYRHRLAPAGNTPMFMAVLALRGAQPIADHAPLTAVKMFNEFAVSVRTLALANGCYPVCDIGDRCVCVAAKSPENLMKLAQAAVLTISVKGNVVTQDAVTPARRRSISCANTTTATVMSRAALTTQISEEMTQSSVVLAATCHPSVACHAMSASCVYDATRDVYFYGTAQLGKVCGALDVAKSGEVCWTAAFESSSYELCREASSTALTSHTLSENGAVTLYVASWWKENGDERDNEDPSTAMAVLSDAYVRRMTVLISEGKGEGKERRRKGDHGGSETRSGTSNHSNDATALTRVATLLHIAIISGDEKSTLEVIRRIVSEEKGVVVSAHESTIVAAFNLLSAGGHHQVRAADTVMRLREALPRTHFACSIQHGKVGALVMDGLVMCTGEAVSQGRILLQSAVALSTAVSGSDVVYLSADTTKAIQHNGLCLLCCHSELSSTYDCEAVDVVSFGSTGKQRVVYLLAHRRSAKATDDEWMYRLKDEEDQSPFAIVNAVFSRIASHDIEGAKRVWQEYEASHGTSHCDISVHARTGIVRHLKSCPPL